MIITPQELQEWINDRKSFTVVDIRLEEYRKEFPLTGLNHIIADIDAIPINKIKSVLICQFGILTEEIIVEQKLDNA